MPTTLTLEGVRPGPVRRLMSKIGLHGVDDRNRWLGDAWSDDANAPSTTDSAIADGFWSMLGWGVLSFAAGTAAIRGYQFVKRQPKLAGVFRRRRRR